MTAGQTNVNSQVFVGVNLHEDCATDAGYCVLPYLTTAYLAGVTCVHVRSQADRLGARRVGSQVKLNLYTVDKLRVLLDFPSRGLTGINWAVLSGGTAAGDFGINNVNTDIEEEVYRSTATAVVITCDTQVVQGVFIDTLALRNHNLTTSAFVQIIGSTVPDFSVVGLVVTLPIEKLNAYYIAPSLPTEAFRYVKIQLNDPSNPAGYLQLGTIVFGSAIILNGEDIVDEVELKTRHFADKVMTEGFSSVSNDRAIRRAIKVQIKNLLYTGGNYKNLRNLFETARTSLKCLWIPTPRYPSRFAAFGKLTEIPTETHNDLGLTQDYVSFPIEVDESL